jgi:AraC family transcriptional regulator of adaptative response / DNA-3-methyladenine glycosylase II
MEDQLGPLGITGARARCIGALAQGIQNGELQLNLTADPREQMEKLLALPGFGPWTVNYVALRALGWPDAFPHTDYGIRKALKPLDARQILELSAAWKPWRSYAAINLWNSLNQEAS